jgi:hypothetical protein
MLCMCDSKKVQWYLDRELADVVQQEEEAVTIKVTLYFSRVIPSLSLSLSNSR